MNYHIVHVISKSKYHGLKGYQEVIDTISWGLQQLGNNVSYAVNAFRDELINIVFGAQMLPLEEIASRGSKTIIYNFEQMRDINRSEMKPQMKYVAERFQVWEYSEFNRAAWQSLNPKYPIKIVPIGHAPILERIGTAKNRTLMSCSTEALLRPD